MKKDRQKCFQGISGCNTVRADGSSPAEIFFSWRRRKHLPMMHTQISKKEFDKLMENWDRLHHTRIKYANRGTRLPSVFQPDDKVLMQDHITKKWTRPVTKLEVRPDLVVKAENRREYIQLNRFLQNLREDTQQASHQNINIS